MHIAIIYLAKSNPSAVIAFPRIGSNKTDMENMIEKIELALETYDDIIIEEEYKSMMNRLND